MTPPRRSSSLTPEKGSLGLTDLRPSLCYLSRRPRFGHWHGTWDGGLPRGGMGANQGEPSEGVGGTFGRPYPVSTQPPTKSYWMAMEGGVGTRPWC